MLMWMMLSCIYPFRQVRQCYKKTQKWWLYRGYEDISGILILNDDKKERIVMTTHTNNSQKQLVAINTLASLIYSEYYIYIY